MQNVTKKQKVLIFIVSYNASLTIKSVLERIPQAMFEDERYISEVLIIDDCSSDNTFKVGYEFAKNFQKFPFTIIKNPKNQGYGGNQKLGYIYALDNNFDHVILLHGDGQYAPEVLPDLILPLINGEADAVFGSRMMVKGDAIKGGMPLYKYYGNKVLTWIENKIAGTELSEYHSGLRLYSCKALAEIPFDKNSNLFDFDTDIILQFAHAKFRIKEIPIPTFYGDEVCNVNGLKYAFDIICNCLHYKIQKLGILYHPKFDFKRERNFSKLEFTSSHKNALNAISENDSVLAVGTIHDDVKKALKEKCNNFNHIEIDKISDFKKIKEKFDIVLLFDCIEQVPSAEEFLKNLRNIKAIEKAKIILFSGNIGFAPIRLMLLLGFFNYSKIGILNSSHKRFFTFLSLRNLLNQNGYEIISQKGLPAPYPLVLSNLTLAKALLDINNFFSKISRSLFAYQIQFEIRTLPNVKDLLKEAITSSEDEIKKANLN